MKGVVGCRCEWNLTCRECLREAAIRNYAEATTHDFSPRKDEDR